MGGCRKRVLISSASSQSRHPTSPIPKTACPQSGATAPQARGTHGVVRLLPAVPTSTLGPTPVPFSWLAGTACSRGERAGEQGACEPGTCHVRHTRYTRRAQADGCQTRPIHPCVPETNEPPPSHTDALTHTHTGAPAW
mgnify:CR=1 FL=1